MNIIDKIKDFLSINKKYAKIIVEDLNKISGESTPLEIALYTDKTPLTDKKIIIDINHKKYEKITDSNGVATLNINLPVGEYDTHITFDDPDYHYIKTFVKVTVNPILVTSDLNMTYKDGSKYTVSVEDSNSNKLSNVKVIFTINGKNYEKQSGENGLAELNINLKQGTYQILTRSYGTLKNNFIYIGEPTPTPTSSNHFGYWIFGRDMLNVNLNDLQSHGVTDILLNYYAIQTHGESTVLDWINKANNLGLHVHIWMQCFYNGSWINPKTTDLTDKINEAKRYANMEGVYGVHLDYLRYPGNAYKTSGATEAVTNFVRNVRSVVGSKFLSCAIMPESDNIYYYGQDAKALGEICDAILPMQYKGNYEAGTSWLEKTTKEFSSKCTIWSGLQSYHNDDDTTILGEYELLNDVKTCLDNGAKGAILFRYGLSPNVTFPSQPTPSPTPSEKMATSMEGTDINMNYKDGTQYQCAVYDVNGRVAGTVNLTVNGKTYTRTPDSAGLYKLNMNLPVGNYTLNAAYVGDDTHLPSTVKNNIIINEPKPQPTPGCTNPYTSSPHPTEPGCNGMGQNNSVYCGPSSIHKSIYKFGIRNIPQGQIAQWAGTTDDGTSHDGINTAIAKISQVTGTNLSVEWYNLSELGWENIGKILCQPNKAVLCHILYQNGGTCEGSGYYGHYESLVKVNLETRYVKVINSLGDYCGNCYCGYYQDRSIACQEQFISGISQKSICVITKN